MRLPAARAWWRRGRAMFARAFGGSYRARLGRELKHFDGCLDVHALPPIFHYWSNRYLRPKLEALGFAHPDAFFALHAGRCLTAAGAGPARIASLGAGNGEMEVRLAQALEAAGHDDFVIECIDVSAAMLDRASKAAGEAGVARRIVTRREDANRLALAGKYDAVLANQSLHHLEALEKIFDGVARALAPHGRFIVSDMIGRNGHLRWPEARAIVEEFWSELPDTYRYHRQLRRHEPKFLDWDCSIDGFEGIRAQDILPLLTTRFGFESFLGFANVIDPFIDRGFGGHFDHLFPPLVSKVLEFGRNVLVFEFDALGSLIPDHGFHLHQIDHADEIFLVADRDLDRHRVGLEA